jgi:hypothetical protein
VDRVKLDADTVSTVPDAPPAAGPDRALDPPPATAGRPAVAAEKVAVVAEPEPLLAAVTMPYAPPAIAIAAAPIAMNLVSLPENMDKPFRRRSNRGWWICSHDARTH